MADKTGIEWTNATWNPVAGCSRVSEGCRNCYAERFSVRFAGPGQRYEGLVKSTPSGPRWTGEMKLMPKAFDQLKKWKTPRRIFVNSMSDLFHEGLTDDEIAYVFAAMAQAPQHTFQVLTKRPARMRAFITHRDTHLLVTRQFRNFYHYEQPVGPWPLPNVWLGVSVENQATATERIPLLVDTPAAVRFLSCEPLLGPVNVSLFLVHGVHWVIAGGESGPGARPMNPEWVRRLRNQCAETDTPFFFKQWGEWQATFPLGLDADPLMIKSGKRNAGKLLDGVEHQAFPEVANG